MPTKNEAEPLRRDRGSTDAAPLRADWPVDLTEFLLGYLAYEAGVDPSWATSWTDPRCLPVLREDIAAVWQRLRQELARLPGNLPRKPSALERAEVARLYNRVRREVDEARVLVRAFAAVSSLILHKTDVERTILDEELYATLEWRHAERVRLWLRHRSQPDRRKERQRYEARVSAPEGRALLAAQSRARYYARLGRSVPETKRNYALKDKEKTT